MALDIGAVFGGLGSIFGGLFGSKKPKVSEKDIATQILGQARGAREAAQKYGFNELALLGLPVDARAGQRDYTAFGRGIADASLMLGDALSARRAAFSETEKLRQGNMRLQERLNRLTLRPPVPGVYQRSGYAVPSALVPASAGSGAAVPVSAAVGGAGRPLVARDDLPFSDPRRGVDNTKVISDSLVSRVDNPNFDPFSIATYNGELIGPGEAMMIGGAWALDRAGKWWGRANADHAAKKDRAKRTVPRLRGQVVSPVRAGLALRVPQSDRRVVGYTMKQWVGGMNRSPRPDNPRPAGASFGYSPSWMFPQ